MAQGETVNGMVKLTAGGRPPQKDKAVELLSLKCVNRSTRWSATAPRQARTGQEPRNSVMRSPSGNRRPVVLCEAIRIHPCIGCRPGAGLRGWAAARFSQALLSRFPAGDPALDGNLHTLFPGVD